MSWSTSLLVLRVDQESRGVEVSLLSGRHSKLVDGCGSGTVHFHAGIMGLLGKLYQHGGYRHGLSCPSQVGNGTLCCTIYIYRPYGISISLIYFFSYLTVYSETLEL